MADTKTKRARLFDRSYDDKNGKATVSDSKTGETVGELNMADAGAKSALGAALRYLTDGWVNAYTAALKAEGGTPEKATEAANEYWDSACSDELTFRAGAGEGGLSVEQEFDVIIKAIVAGNFADEAAAKAEVERCYAVTTSRKQTIKGKDGKPDVVRDVTNRPEYVKLKRIPQIREALIKAEGDDSAEQLGARFAKPE